MNDEFSRTQRQQRPLARQAPIPDQLHTSPPPLPSESAPRRGLCLAISALLMVCVVGAVLVAGYHWSLSLKVKNHLWLFGLLTNR